MANAKGEALYQGIVEAFDEVLDPKTGRVSIELLGKAANSLLPVYEYIFGVNLVSSTLKEDLVHSSSSVLAAYMKNPKERTHVEAFIQSELYERGHSAIRKDRFSGVRNLLWLKRAFDFMATFLFNLMISPEFKDVEAKDAAFIAYNEILRPYHGFLVSNIVTLAFQLCPSRVDIQRRLGFEDDELVVHRVHSIVGILRPVVEEVSENLKRWDCNFPDKA